jgi:pimeloyl-ACP methyl ester carboxylesterase
VGGLSWGGGLALERYRRHPEIVCSLILASAYAGWAGSLSAEVVDQRLQLMLRNSDLPPDQWAPALVETFFSKDPPPKIVSEAVSIVSYFHPRATRVAMQAFAEADLSDVLPRVVVPTLLLCGEDDVRAPRSVWETLHSGIRGSKLVLIPRVGHVIDIEAAERFNTEVKVFLASAEPRRPRVAAERTWSRSGSPPQARGMGRRPALGPSQTHRSLLSRRDVQPVATGPGGRPRRGNRSALERGSLP